MADQPILFAAPMLALLRAGHKTQVRRLAGSPLGECRAGDRLWVREMFAPLAPDGTGRLHPVAPHAATVAVMKDGWHQHRDGHGAAGGWDHAGGAFHRPRWAPALKMPRWASRTTIIVEAARIERLQAITRDDAIAEGLRPWPPLIGGAWRLPPPHHLRLWLSPVAAYRALWDATRGTPGERWADDPLVVALRFRVVAGNIEAVA